MSATSQDPYDYIVVGSGAGGGPVAANLAKAGFRVLVLEAGGTEQGPNYEVPSFHPFATEDEAMRWDFFVKHYDDAATRAQDSKYQPQYDGVLYPRAGTLGGCTAHNALITVYPSNSDWDDIARTTGDESWSSDAMRRYFERLENCNYAHPTGVLKGRTVLAALAWLILAIWSVILSVLRLREYDPTRRARHGFSGWLHTETPDPRLLLHDPELLDVVFDAAVVELEGLGIRRFLRRLQTRFDPNDWGNVKANAEGVCLTPTATNRGRRNGTRELLLATRDAHPERLEIRTGVLVTRVILDDTRRATGVAYVEGDHVYRADPRASAAPSISPELTVSARREVILCAGAFNTPQLLKLSGIGPREELERHRIPVRVELPGVGENLQDRYEVGVISEMQSQFKLLRNVSFQAPSPGSPPDETFQEWERGEGPYVTNGVVIAIMKRSRPELPVPDLYVFGIPGYFKGYYPGYSKDVTKRKDLFTWAILKAHTENRAGSVLLRSKDPRDTPDIHFRYFQEGTNGGVADLDAVMHGVELVRRIMRNANAVVARELLPGAEIDSVSAMKDFIKREAWGHHASCSAKMGAADDPLAVVDSEFRVFNTTGLRIVDASIFPRIPGFFIVTSVYMIAEKASDLIAAAAAQALPAETPATGAA